MSSRPDRLISHPASLLNGTDGANASSPELKLKLLFEDGLDEAMFMRSWDLAFIRAHFLPSFFNFFKELLTSNEMVLDDCQYSFLLDLWRKMLVVIEQLNKKELNHSKASISTIQLLLNLIDSLRTRLSNASNQAIFVEMIRSFCQILPPRILLSSLYADPSSMGTL